MRSYISSAFKSTYLYTHICTTVHIHIYTYICVRTHTHIFFKVTIYEKSMYPSRERTISRKEFKSMHLACVPVSRSEQTTLPNSKEEIYFSLGFLFSSSPRPLLLRCSCWSCKVVQKESRVWFVIAIFLEDLWGWSLSVTRTHTLSIGDVHRWFYFFTASMLTITRR